MKVKVVLAEGQTSGAGKPMVVHEASWVTVNNSQGVLTVQCLDQHGEPASWAIYAAGMWVLVEMTEAPDEYAKRARAIIEQRTRDTGGGPAGLNGGRGY